MGPRPRPRGQGRRAGVVAEVRGDGRCCPGRRRPDRPRGVGRGALARGPGPVPVVRRVLRRRRPDARGRRPGARSPETRPSEPARSRGSPRVSGGAAGCSVRERLSGGRSRWRSRWAGSSCTWGRARSAAPTTSTSWCASSSRAPRSPLLIAVQELDSRPIAEAILAARAREGARPGDPRGRLPDGGHRAWPTRGPTAATSRSTGPSTRRCCAPGVDVITDLNPAIFHQKFIVRDHGESTLRPCSPARPTSPCTDTGTNPPTTGQRRQQPQPRRGAARAADRASQYLAEFERLRSGTFGDLHERHEARPVEFRLGEMRVKPLFAPQARAGDGDHEADAQGRVDASTSRCSPSRSPPASTTR